MFNKVMDKLNELGIKVQIVEHEPALTTEQADKFIEGIEGVRTKTMFLTNRKKKNFYLVIMDEMLNDWIWINLRKLQKKNK